MRVRWFTSPDPDCTFAGPFYDALVARIGGSSRLDRPIPPPMTPDQYQEPRWARFLFASTTAAWLWLVVRLYIASVFLPAGWEKMTSGKWLFGDGAPIQGLVSGAI